MRFHRPVVLLFGGVGLVLLAGLVVTLLVVRQPEAVYAPMGARGIAERVYL